MKECAVTQDLNRYQAEVDAEEAESELYEHLEGEFKLLIETRARRLMNEGKMHELGVLCSEYGHCLNDIAMGWLKSDTLHVDAVEVFIYRSTNDIHCKDLAANLVEELDFTDAVKKQVEDYKRRSIEMSDGV